MNLPVCDIEASMRNHNCCNTQTTQSCSTLDSPLVPRWTLERIECRPPLMLGSLIRTERVSPSSVRLQTHSTFRWAHAGTVCATYHPYALSEQSQGFTCDVIAI
eukprot:7092657-Pyramimonas_sp.AAC.1